MPIENEPSVVASDAPADAVAAARGLLEAMFMRDRAGIERLTLEHAGRELLWQGSEPSALEISDMLEELERIVFRVAHSGEILPMPDGSYVAAPPATSDRLFLLMRPPGAAGELPFPMVRRSGRWLVDPAPLIAARR